MENLAPYVDKYEVRRYVRDVVGEEYLVPLIGVYDSAQDINFGSLPQSFVAKATHGSGWTLIVKEHESINCDLIRRKLERWLKLNYYRITGERQYKWIKPRIVLEELLNDPSGDLKDYKFFCIYGEPAFIQVDGFRFVDHRRDILDLSWKKIPCRLRYDNLPEPIEKPTAAEEMVEVCRKLAEPFPFVRVDLYCVEGRVYFGELTFTPGNAMEMFFPRDYDYIFGKNIPLAKRYIS